MYKSERKSIRVSCESLKILYFKFVEMFMGAVKAMRICICGDFSCVRFREKGTCVSGASVKKSKLLKKKDIT